MTYLLSGLPREAFAPYFAMTDEELEAASARRVIADADRGFPCRVSLRDATVGQRLILLNHVSHEVPGPFRTAYAIYVAQDAEQSETFVDDLAHQLASRRFRCAPSPATE